MNSRSSFFDIPFEVYTPLILPKRLLGLQALKTAQWCQAVSDSVLKLNRKFTIQMDTTGAAEMPVLYFSILQSFVPIVLDALSGDEHVLLVCLLYFEHPRIID